MCSSLSVGSRIHTYPCCIPPPHKAATQPMSRRILSRPYRFRGCLTKIHRIHLSHTKLKRSPRYVPALPHSIKTEQSRINTSWDQKETAAYRGGSPHSFMFIYVCHACIHAYKSSGLPKAYMTKVRGHDELLIFNFFSDQFPWQKVWECRQWFNWWHF